MIEIFYLNENFEPQVSAVGVYIVHSSKLLSFTGRSYDNPEHIKELGGIDTGKYIASCIVVFNLDKKTS